MKKSEETTIITDVSGASEEDLLREIINRYDNVVIIIEAPYKTGDKYYNNLYCSGSITNALGLLKYAKYRLENDLDEYLRRPN